MSSVSVRSLSNIIKCSPDSNYLFGLMICQLKRLQVHCALESLNYLKVVLARQFVCLEVELELQAVRAVELDPLAVFQ